MRLHRDTQRERVLQLASYSCSAQQQIPFKRLNVNCPSSAFDFLSGILRRSRLNILRLTCDVQFLGNLPQVSRPSSLSLQLHVSRDPKRRYWSNVEDLWLLLVGCSDAETEAFERVFPELFTVVSLSSVISPFAGAAAVVHAASARPPRTDSECEPRSRLLPPSLPSVARQRGATRGQRRPGLCPLG